MATSGSDNNPLGDREVDRSDSVLLVFHRDALHFFFLSRVQSFYRFAQQLPHVKESTLQWLVDFFLSS